MDKLSAQIFLSQLPDITEIHFSDKVSFNQVKLKGKEESEVALEEAAHFILLPVTGDLYLKSDNDSCEVNIGEIKVCRQKKGSRIAITNPYDQDIVDFIQIIIQDRSITTNESPDSFVFNLEASLNSLIPVCGYINKPSFSFNLHIGQFGGRKETVFQTRSAENAVYAFVISGAFEMEGRLLHPKDGLALWNASSVEIEALSDNALLLVLECGSNNP